jgi:6-phosphogluconolactonase
MATRTNYKANLRIVDDARSLPQTCIEVFLDAAHKAIENSGVFYVAISGGHTPKGFFEVLGEDSSTTLLPWDKIHVFWVDERYVPADSPRSNYKLAMDTFLVRVPIPAENIHRVVTDYTDMQAAANDYENTLKEVFGLAEGQVPQFDLVILGMGADGHTGSLFPNTSSTFDKKDLACVVYVLDQELDEQLARVTLTQPVICAARKIVVLVSGEQKAKTLKSVLTSEPDEVRYPIHILWPVLDKVVWLVDAPAASLLQK